MVNSETVGNCVNKPSADMDCEKLCALGSDGCYCLCFYNKYGLSVPQIRNIFSKYGDVVNVHYAKTLISYHFVRFRRKEETLRCIMGLRGHPQIFLEPVRRKAPKEDNLSTITSKEDQIMTNGLNSALSINPSEMNFPEQTIIDTPEPLSIDVALPAVANMTASKIVELPSPIIADMPSPKIDDVREPIIADMNSLNDPVVANMTVPMIVELPSPKIADVPEPIIADLTSPKITDVPQPISVDIDASKTEGMHSVAESPLLVDDDVPPPLVPSISPISYSKKFRKILAQDVIVGNMHEILRVSNIYHLFRKYDPISVSDVEIVPRMGVRYCHVYLKSVEDALEVEERFDGLEIYGKALIVLRSHKLEEEAGNL